MTQEFFPLNCKIDPKIGDTFVKVIKAQGRKKRAAVEIALEAYIARSKAEAEALKKAGLSDAKVVN